MKEYTVINHGEEMPFIGKLLAMTNTKKEPDQKVWTEFEIYLCQDETFIVNVVKKFISGESTGRSFPCPDLYGVQRYLAHPVYLSVSFRAQLCYNNARKALIADDLIKPHEFPLTLDEEDRPVMMTPEQESDIKTRQIEKLWEEDEDFDFSE